MQVLGTVAAIAKDLYAPPASTTSAAGGSDYLSSVLSTPPPMGTSSSPYALPQSLPTAAADAVALAAQLFLGASVGTDATTANHSASTTARPTTTTPYITVTTTALGEEPYDDPLREIMYANVFLSFSSLCAASFVLAIFGFQLWRSSSTAMRSSLNYLWASALVCTIATSVGCLVIYSLWLTRGNDVFLEDRSACVWGNVVHDFFRTALAGLLLSYYVHIYFVKRLDEPRARKGMPFYYGFSFLLALGVAVFSAIETPKSFDAIGRCEGGMTSMTSSAFILVPVVIELCIVIAGLCAAFNLLCSDSRVTTASSRRRVAAHVVFMLFLFASRAVVALVTMTRSGPSSDAEGGDDEPPERLSSLPFTVQVLYMASVFHNWAMGIIMSAVFAYSECLFFVARRMLLQNDVGQGAGGNAYGAGEGKGGAALINGGCDEKDAVSLSEGSGGGAGGGRSGRPRGDSAHSDVHALSRPFRRSEEAIIEDHLQARTLSYTVRASSLYAEGALPPPV